jgi:hypothetical protein
VGKIVNGTLAIVATVFMTYRHAKFIKMRAKKIVKRFTSAKYSARMNKTLALRSLVLKYALIKAKSVIKSAYPEKVLNSIKCQLQTALRNMILAGST